MGIYSYLFSELMCPEQDSNLGLSKLTVFEDCKATTLTLSLCLGGVWSILFKVLVFLSFNGHPHSTQKGILVNLKLFLLQTWPHCLPFSSSFFRTRLVITDSITNAIFLLAIVIGMIKIVRIVKIVKL